MMYPPEFTNMTIAGTSTMNESMYFLLNMGIFQPVMLVFRGVCFPCVLFLFLLLFLLLLVLVLVAVACLHRTNDL